MTETPEQAGLRRVLAACNALGPIGVSVPTLGPTELFPMAQQLAGARRLEQAGYRAAWAREGVGGHDALVEIAAMLGATDSIVFGSAVANMWARPAQTLHAASTVLSEAYPGRFVLGVGPGMAFQAEALGQSFSQPYSRMRDYLDAMTAPNPALVVAEQDYPRVLAVNGPRMLELARTTTDGAHPGLVPVEYTAAARATLGPDKLLISALTVVAMPDRDAAREIARQFAVAVLGFPGSPYGANIRRLGFTEDEITSGADRVVDAIIGYGGPDDIAAKAQEHLDAGADHVVVNLALPGYDQGIDQFEWLAPTLTAIVG